MTPYLKAVGEMDRQEFSYESTGTLTLVVIALLFLGVVMSVMGAVSTSLQIELVQEIDAINRGVHAEDDRDSDLLNRVDRNDRRQLLIGIAEFATMVLTAINFLVWTYRSSKNGHALNSINFTYRPGWCVGYHFIPILNLFKPYQAMKEIYQSSAPGVYNWRGVSTGLLPVWWFLWLASSFAGRVSFRLGLRAETTEQLLTSSYVDLVHAFLDVPLSLVLICIVRTVHRNQEAKASQERTASRRGRGSICSNCGEPVDTLMRHCGLRGEPISSNPHWMK